MRTPARRSDDAVGAGALRVGQDRDARELRDGDPEQLELLSGQVRGDVRQAGRIPARPRERRRKPGGHRVANQDEDDRDGRGDGLHGLRGDASTDHEDIDLEADELGGELRYPVEEAFRQVRHLRPRERQRTMLERRLRVCQRPVNLRLI